MNVHDHVQDGKLPVWVQPGADKNSIDEWQEGRERLKVSIAEPAEDNKANKELVNFMADELGTTVWLKDGYDSRKKLLIVEE